MASTSSHSPIASSSSSSCSTSTSPPISPPLVRISSSLRPALAPPVFLDSLVRATLPSSSLSPSIACHPDLVKPPPVRLERASLSVNRSRRSRSNSIGSLKALMMDGGETIRSPRERSQRRLSSSSAGSNQRTLLANGELQSPREELEAGEVEGGIEVGPRLSDLTWDKWWWPIDVVAPPTPSLTSDKGKGKAIEIQSEDQDPTTWAGKVSGSGSRAFLELFVGKGSGSTARASGKAASGLTDAQEAALLDAPLEEVIHRARTIEREADETPPHFLTGTSPKRPTTFLPTSMFSSGPSHLLEGPSSLFSAFSVSNPFTPSTSPTRGSALSTSPLTSPPTTPRNTLPHHGRSYSSGPGTKRQQVDGLLDEEDKKAAKVEDDSHMDMFSLIKERYNCPKYPIIFCHGLFGFDVIGPASIKPLQFSYWIGIKEALEALGVEVLIGRVPASASIEERAKVLCELIEKTFPGREVNLIGHSMGGLDCRFLISHLKPTTFKVRSVTTIATPHRGSPFADFMLEDVIGKKRVPALLGILSGVGLPGGGKAFDDLTTTKMARFNDETPDDPNVKYYSYGAQFKPGWSNAFRLSWGVVNEREGANDGLVSVESSRWGVYKATLDNVNHLDLVGWVGIVRYGWAEWLGKPIKFKPVSFYCAVAEMLADDGF